LIGSSVIGLID
jgi:hypothetical protein